MSYINSSCPLIYCRVRREFLFDLQAHHGELEDAVIIGVNSLRGRALGFTCVLRNGAQFTRLPLHAFVHKDSAPKIPLGALELWDCFDYYFTVMQFAFLPDKPCNVLLRDVGWCRGKYLFTVDWCAGNADADLGDSEDSEHKSAHMIKLNNGCFAALPNNRCIWLDPAFVDQPLDIGKDGHPGYRTQSHTWSVERDWHVPLTADFFYGDVANKDDSDQN